MQKKSIDAVLKSFQIMKNALVQRKQILFHFEFSPTKKVAEKTVDRFLKNDFRKRSDVQLRRPSFIQNALYVFCIPMRIKIKQEELLKGFAKKFCKTKSI